MEGRRKDFFEFWRSKKERGALVERANQLRLLPSQQKRLLGDAGLRSALQNGPLVSLLPPTGTEVFKRFSPALLEEIRNRQESEGGETKKDEKEEAEEDRPKASSHLEAGKPLPFVFGDPPPQLLDTPLEELDPFYQSQKTFITLSRGNILQRFNAESSRCLPSPFNPLRKAAIKTLHNPLYQLFLLVTLLINAIFMSFNNIPWETFLITECLFASVFSLDLLMKVVSRGCSGGRFTFIRDPWNWLDVLVVMTAYIDKVHMWLSPLYILGSITRILKIITVIPGLKRYVEDLVRSSKRLTEVLVLTLFGLSLLSIMALQLFMGTLSNKCVLMFWATNGTPEPFDFYLSNVTGGYLDWGKQVNNQSNHYFLPGQLDALMCGNSSDSGACPEGYMCLSTGSNPNYGFTNYDWFGWTFLSMFRVLTRDWWENLMLLTMRSSGKFHVLFFLLFVAPCCFCLLSLFLSAVAMASRKREEETIAAAKQKDEEFARIVGELRRREEPEEPEAVEEPNSCRKCCYGLRDALLKWDCCGCWRAVKQALFCFVSHPFFDLAVVVCLIINVVFMAMEHYPLTESFEENLSVAGLVFTAIFTAEMFLKVVALDPYGYFKVSWNVFDSIIVAMSVLELVFADVQGLHIFRVFILLRAFRLARWWPCFHTFLKLLSTLTKSMRNPTLLLLIAVFLFSVAGKQLFGNDYKDCVCRISADCVLPRWHMTDLYHTFLIVFRALYGEWIETLWDCMEVSRPATCLIFYTALVLIGNLLILNLFLTLLLSTFSSVSCSTQEKMEKNNVTIAIRMIKTWTLGQFGIVKKTSADNPGSEVKALDGKYHDGGSPKAPIAEVEIELKMHDEVEEKKFEEAEGCPEVQPVKDKEDPKRATPEDCCCGVCYRCCSCLNLDTSWGCGRVWSTVRRACFNLVEHRYFNIFMILVILLSGFALCFEDIYLQQRPTIKLVLVRADQVFSTLFLMEMLLKWSGLGFKKYFSDPWCWLDFLILGVSLLSLTNNSVILYVGDPVTPLRALMPLRLLSRFKGIRVVVQTVVRSVPPLMDMVLVSALVWLIFGLYGVRLFAGTFRYCFNETSEDIFHYDSISNKSGCLDAWYMNYTEVSWKNTDFNFDNVPNAFLSLLHLASSDHWLDVLYSMVDAVQVEDQPKYEFNTYRNLFVVVFAIVGVFFVLNFYIRGVVDKLHRDKVAGKQLYMTENQQKNCKVLKRRFSSKPQKPPRPQNGCRARIFDLVTAPYYEVAMLAVICLNMVLLMVEWNDMSAEGYKILFYFHSVLFLIFLVECVLKITALGRDYFKDSLNIIDFVLLIVCFVDTLIADFFIRYLFPMTILTMLRLGRISRILPLWSFTRRVRHLLVALRLSFPAFLNIGFLLLILTITLSLFAMFHFPFVKKQHLLNDLFNFETFCNSFICLFSMTTASSWAEVFKSLTSRPPECDPLKEHPGFWVTGDCADRPVAAAFFLSSLFLFPLLLVLHLYIAVVLEVLDSEGGSEPLTDEDLQKFYKTWRQFDPKDSQFIQYSQLSDLCDVLQEPLRISKPNSVRLTNMDLPLHPGDQIHQSDLLLALCKQVSDDPEEIDALKAKMEEKLKAKTPKVL